MMSQPPAVAETATCSRANLIKCLDSVCGLNNGANPAARCQYCGTNAAGNAPSDTGMQQISIGASAKTTISDKELKNAPDDQGSRYIWATSNCIKKNIGCTDDDVSREYDKLIEQSCKSAGITSQIDSLNTAAKKTKTKPACESAVRVCVLKKCNGDFSGCREDSDYDKFFSACTVETSGCDVFARDINNALGGTRKNSIENQEKSILELAAMYQNMRAKKQATAKSNCTDNAAKNSCIDTVCEKNMKNKCAVGWESEKSIAVSMCVFYDVACANLKDKE